MDPGFKDFITLIGGLKRRCRSSETKSGRKESVADHTWRLALMVLLAPESFDLKFDFCRAIKMALIHDLAEAILGDIPTCDLLGNELAMQDRHKREKSAFETMTSALHSGLRKELLELWLEFEENRSPEARLVNFFDKLEALMQNTESKIVDPVIKDFPAQVESILLQAKGHECLLELVKELIEENIEGSGLHRTYSQSPKGELAEKETEGAFNGSE